MNNVNNVDDLTDLFDEIESEIQTEIKNTPIKEKDSSIANIFDELEVEDYSDIFDKLDLPKDLDFSDLDEAFAEVHQEKLALNSIMLEHLNYDSLLDIGNLDPQFVKITDQVIAEAAERGHIFQFADDVKYIKQPKKFSLFRFKPENIDKLLSFIETKWNPSRVDNFHPKPVKLFCSDVDDQKLNPNSFPNMSEFNINTNAEACQRKCLHAPFDIETNKHQQLFAEIYLDKDIEGGVKGVYFAEAKRYLKFFHVRKKKDRKICTYQTIDQQGTFVNFWGTNPKEGIKLCAAELSLSQILLSSMMDGQKELISIFTEVAEKIPFPINTELLRQFLFHEVFVLFICHNANFDQNRIIDTFQRNRQKGNHILLESTTPKSQYIMHGQIKETIETEARYFKLPMGNTLAGLRDKFRLDTQYLSKGKPDIFIGPVQTDSPYASLAVDTNILGHACQFKMPVSLGKISQNTNFPKLKEDEFSKKEKVFTQSEFFFVETDDHFEMSKADYYLLRDCLATLAGYGKETQMLDLTRISKATKVNLDYIQLEPFPLVYDIYSTATLAKKFTLGELLQETGLSKEQIFNNLRKTRPFFQHWNKIQESYFENGEHITQIHPIWFAGRIESYGYGYFKVEPENKLWSIADLDFRSQYPFCARQNCSSQQLYLASNYQLHYKRNSDIHKLQNRFWFGIEAILKGIHDTGSMPDKTLIYFNFLAKVSLKKRFHLRSTEKPIKFPKKQYWKRPIPPKKCDRRIKGTNKPVFGTELAHSVIRMYELSPYYFSNMSEVNRKSKILEWESLTHDEKINKIKSYIIFQKGEFLDFDSSDVKDEGEETYTKLYRLRDTIRSVPHEKESDIDLQQQQMKIIMNGKIGLNNEGNSKGYSGRFQCPSIPVGITGNAKFCANLAEIYCRKWGGIPIYTHTDSLKLIGSRKTVERVKELFIHVDPLGEEAEKDETYQDIDFIFVHGKAKYAMHSAKTDTWHLTDSGTGAYGSWLLNPIYKQFVKLLYEGIPFQKAVHLVKKDFPLSYQLSLKRTRKQIKGSIQTLKRLFKTKPIEAFEFTPKCSIYLFEEKVTKEDKLGRKRTTWRKVISTSPHFNYGNFSSYHNFKIPKMDKRLIKKKQKLIAKIKRLAINNKQFRGWSKLTTIKELELALKQGFIPQPISSRPSLVILPEAKELAEKFPNLNQLTAQHLLNLIEKLSGAIDLEDFEQFDKTLIYDELKTLLLEKYGSLDDSESFQEMDETQLFEETKDNIRIDYENNLLSEVEYNQALDGLYEKFQKQREPTSRLKREYISPYPKAANNIIFTTFAPINFKAMILFILENSKSLTTHERNIIVKQLKERPEAVTHLKNRYSFHTKFYQREIPSGMETRIKTIIKKRIMKKSKRKELNEYLGLKSKNIHPKLKKKIEKAFTKPSTITNLIWGKNPKFNFIELIPSNENHNSDSNLPCPDKETSYPSDGIGYTGTITFPMNDFSEYQMGNKNRAVGQALVNTARTMSCEYVKTHVDNEETKEKLLMNYIHKLAVEKLPCPKMGGKIHRHDNYSGTTRTKFSFLPKFNNFQENDVVSGTHFTITFYDYIQTWLKEKVIEDIPNTHDFLIKVPEPINDINSEIHKRTWKEYDFLGRKWTFELLPWLAQESERANGSFFVGVVAGKNKKINYSMYFNPSTNRLINFNLFPTRKFELIEESDLIKKIMRDILTTNTLTAFLRNACLTPEDYKEKKKPTPIIEKIYLCLAQVALESAVENSTTKLFKYHITEDIKLKTQDEADFTIFLLNRAMQKTYAEVTHDIPELIEEIKYRKRIGIGQSKQGNASALNNFPRSRHHVSYFKNEHQLINKLKRVYMDRDLPESMFKDFRERVKLKGNIIRIETQLESFKTIMDAKSYESHEFWKEITLLALRIARHLIKSKHNPLQIFDDSIEQIIIRKKEKEITLKLKTKCREFLDFVSKDLYPQLPYIQKPP